MINLTIDPNLATPPFEQLKNAVMEKIRTGELTPGTRLPAVRKLAGELELAANTVARAYRELETAGFVQTRGRNGTIVSPDLNEPDRHIRALALAEEYVTGMAALSLDDEQMATYLNRAQRGRAE